VQRRMRQNVHVEQRKWQGKQDRIFRKKTHACMQQRGGAAMPDPHACLPENVRDLRVT